MAKKTKKDILEDVKVEEEKTVEETTEEVVEESKHEIKEPEEVKESLTLRFGNGGWCEELQKSYRPGIYVCKNQKEYDALKKYALDNERFK